MNVTKNETPQNTFYLYIFCNANMFAGASKMDLFVIALILEGIRLCEMVKPMLHSTSLLFDMNVESTCI